jgi:hypothetical protein
MASNTLHSRFCAGVNQGYGLGQGGDRLAARDKLVANPARITLAGEEAGDGAPVDFLPVIQIMSARGASGVDMADKVEMSGEGAA